jgi:CcmD family protein
MKALITCLWSLFLTVPLVALQPPAGQPPVEGFEPIDKLPPAEQLPAAPLLVAAYAFAWLAVFFYLWTVWRRLNKVEAELRTFEKRHRTNTR